MGGEPRSRELPLPCLLRDELLGGDSTRPMEGVVRAVVGPWLSRLLSELLAEPPSWPTDERESVLDEAE